jgi:uncharacterized membrane protein YfcA
MHGGRMQREARHTSLLVAAVVGILAGFLSGLFGVGGGILIVPGLVILMSMGQRLAHGTSLAAVIAIAVSGVVTYALHDRVDWPVGGLLIAGSTVGAVLGIRVLHHAPQRWLRLLFAGFLVASAFRLLFDTGVGGGRGPLSIAGVIGLVAVGMVAGILAGLLGVGGGIVMIPAMVVLFDITNAVAKGTSLLVIIPTATVGTIGNLRRSNADLRVAAVVGLFGAAAAYFGSHLSLHMSDRLSNVLFASLLFVVAIRLFLQREPAPAPALGEA